jgi:hypothetical protein
MCDGRAIDAKVLLSVGDADLRINQFYGSYSYDRNKCSLMKAHKHMEKAISHWVKTEYEKTKS